MVQCSIAQLVARRATPDSQLAEVKCKVQEVGSRSEDILSIPMASTTQAHRHSCSKTTQCTRSNTTSGASQAPAFLKTICQNIARLIPVGWQHTNAACNKRMTQQTRKPADNAHIHCSFVPSCFSGGCLQILFTRENACQGMTTISSSKRNG